MSRVLQILIGFGLLFVLSGVAGTLAAGGAGRGTGVGELASLGCVGAVSGTPPGCAVASGLVFGWGVAVSPDGRSVYAVGFKSDSVESFLRHADGTLAPGTCVGDDGLSPPGCSNKVLGLQGPSGLAVSPDGKSLYVAAEADGILQTFSLGANGTISPHGCIGTIGLTSSCGKSANLLDVSAVAVSRDGRTVYAAAGSSNAVEVFNRDPTGLLTPAGCLGAPANCTHADGLEHPDSVTVSPDDRNVYVGSGDAIAILSRDTATGAIQPAGCVRTIGAGPVSCTTQANLVRVSGVVVSPDGANVYAVSTDTNAVEAFARTPGSGALTEVGCLGNTGSGPKGCAGVAGLGSPIGLEVSPDGKSVYVATSLDLVVFTRGGDGRLSETGCFVADTSATSSNCATAPGLDGPLKVAVSPDGKNVYVTTTAPGSIVEFARATTNAPATTNETTTGAAAPIGARLVFATVLPTGSGRLTLEIRLRVTEPVTARVELLAPHSTVALSRGFKLAESGGHTLVIALPATVSRGTHTVVIAVSDSSKRRNTLTTTVLVPRS